MFNRIISYFYHMLNPNHEHTVIKVVEETRIIHTMSKETMNKLRARLPNPILSSSDSSEVASFKLGVQCALLELEKGFVN